MTRERLWPIVLGGWVLASIVLCIALWRQIAGIRFPDPDDAMRLLQVRDWIGGQSWWDVGQHRLNGGHFPMHWSRLVDLPIAGAMLIFDPLVGIATSDRIAMTIVPLLTLLALMGIAAALTRRVSDRERATMALLLAPLSIPIIYQIRPMRIDHHGWQVVLALAAATLLVGPPTTRRGALAGLSLATLVTISLEGLPVAVAITTVAALAWAWDPRRRAFLVALTGSFFAVSLAFQVATRGPGMMAPACDAMSPAWIAVLGVAAAALTMATAIRSGSLLIRLGALAIGGAACGATLLVLAPQCLAGPFATLDPLVYTVWYENVSEGMPIWRQTPSLAIMTIAFPIVGLVGTVLALKSSDGAARERWTILLAVLAFAFVLSLLVARTGATANALALPGGAWLLVAMLHRTRRIGPVLPRTLATAGAMIAVSPGLAAGGAFALRVSHAKPTVSGKGAIRPACTDFADVRALDGLPPATVFAPIDISPDIIATTADRAIGGGYHRNAQAMHRIIAAFTAAPDAARGAIVASGARYVVGCPGLAETEIYKAMAPNGLWARLERGEHVTWLRPVPIAGSPVLAWAVLDSSRAPLSNRVPHR